MNYDYSDKITLVSLNDSLLQNLKSNNQSKNDIVVYRVAEKLSAKGLENILPIDCGNLFVNKQHNINEFLRNNLSLAEIKMVQQLGIDKARHGVAKLAISPKLKNYYNIEKKDEKIHISDAIKESKKVGVLLSCVSNDIMSSVWVNPISYMLAHIPFMDKNVLKRTKVLLKDESLRDIVIDGLKQNIENILGINDKARICVFGIYRPKILPKDFDFIFNEINSKVADLSNIYSQSYIDINDVHSKIIDFHPNADGYETIANRVANELYKMFNKDCQGLNVPPFNYQNLGLDGAIHDSRLYFGQEIEYINNFIIELSKKYNCSGEQLMKIFSDFLSGRPQEAMDMTDIYFSSNQQIKQKKYL